MLRERKHTKSNKEVGLEESAEKSEYMIIYRQQNAGENHKI
jgi:hypothetical protein